MLLAGRGYRVIGADLSEDMLAEAERKARELPEGSRPFHLPADAEASSGGAGGRGDLRAGQPQLSDASGRLPEDARRVYNALKSGGLFVFDINTPAKLRGLDGQVFLDETDDTYCVWRTEFDAKKRLCFLWHGHFPAERQPLGSLV